MTVPETESMDWQQNVLMGQTMMSADSFDIWYEQNRNNSAFTNIGGAYGRTYYRNLSNGEVVRVNAEGMADYYGSVPVFNTDILKKEVVEIIFLDTLADAPKDAWDVSEAQDGSVRAWAVPDGKGMYILTLAADGGICAADACGRLFYGFSGLKHIRFNNAFHTEGATRMYGMFGFCLSPEGDLDLSGFDVSKVTNMKWMFSGCSGLRELQVGSWTIRTDCDREGMFDRCDNLPASMKAAAGG